MGGMRPIGSMLRRGAWIAGGLVAVAIGGIGIVVPGLPTTVFFIIAAACFARSHPPLERWVLDLPRIGPAVHRYRAGLGMPVRAKWWAIGSMVVFSGVSAVVVDLLAFRLALVLVAAIGVWYVWRRVPTTPDHVLDATDR